jgi:hypothetical protein
MRVPLPQRVLFEVRTARMKKTDDEGEPHSASELISQRISELGDWSGATLAYVRRLILCTGETYKKAVTLTFAKGASLKDPATLFTSSLEGREAVLRRS